MATPPRLLEHLFKEKKLINTLEWVLQKGELEQEMLLDWSLAKTALIEM